MTLIKSISGIRGTIGGVPGEGLSPLDIVKFSAAYGTWIINRSGAGENKIVLGRDARISGQMVEGLICNTLSSLGIQVLNLGLTTTPTVEIAVAEENASGGIIITASHNPGEWNALKLLNEKGEFISAEEGALILEIAKNESFEFVAADRLGKIESLKGYASKHIDMILQLDLVNVESIRQSGFKVVVDCVNSVGGIVLPELLKALGVKEVIELYCEPTGMFPHNPEPLPEHLTALSEKVISSGADLGFSVDPDVDRLAIVDNNGQMFGEEYTLVAVADYVLGQKSGNTVSNLSSSRALKDVTESHRGNHYASAVGEVNVVAMMKSKDAVIGGEGNGGVIYPELHYGRDALVGIALFLTHLAKRKVSVSDLRKTYPDYYISKNKIVLDDKTDVDAILEKVAGLYSRFEVNLTDGVKIDLPEGWIHLRKSNTEAIIRVYSESSTSQQADRMAREVMDAIRKA